MQADPILAKTQTDRTVRSASLLIPFVCRPEYPFIVFQFVLATRVVSVRGSRIRLVRLSKTTHNKRRHKYPNVYTKYSNVVVSRQGKRVRQILCSSRFADMSRSRFFNKFSL